MKQMWRWAAGLPARLVMAALVVLAVLLPALAHAQDRVNLVATSEDGFARLVFDFGDRLDLPGYKLNYENGVLAIVFAKPVRLLLPDVAVMLPDYVAIGRVDPDSKGVRFGLRTAVIINSLEAGQKLFVDILPANWQGLPPGLPPEVVAALAARAKDAMLLAEQKRKADEARMNNPTAKVRSGRNPTFMRVEFDWNVDAEAKFVLDGDTGALHFAWPVPIDLSALNSNLPPEIAGVTNKVTADGSVVTFTLAHGVVPRFYEATKRQFIVDIDLSAEEIAATADAAAKKAADLELAARLAEAEKDAARVARSATAVPDNVTGDGHVAAQTSIRPVVANVAGTVRINFPFDSDTASAVFRRGDTVWMLFDTRVAILEPIASEALQSVASDFTVVPSGETQIVRLDLSADRLATLGSEGRSWVLSLGDVLLNPTVPLTLNRIRDKDGHFQMAAQVGKPFKVHAFHDPVVGDELEVVTAFPPARGSMRSLSFVDFEALRSVHGLVVRPQVDDLEVAINGDRALISSPAGLILSDATQARALDGGNADQFRDSFVDLASAREDNPAKLVERREELIETAASAEGKARDLARLNLGQFYLGNEFAEEAIGVLEVLDQDLKDDALKKKLRLSIAIANILAARPNAGLGILDTPVFADEVDALMWRAIGKANAYDYVGARRDALAGESAIGAYPLWVRQKFLFAGIRSALETNDLSLAQRYMGLLSFAQLSPEQVSFYQLFQGRIAEAQGLTQEALDDYGQVITADIRPSRAEAVYRTLVVLQTSGTIDLAKATETLSAEAIMWRGNPLEADMQRLLAELYFQHGDYRLGFETVRQAVAYYPESVPMEGLLAEAEAQFGNLFINGAADRLGDTEALSLYYDFRQLTPPGARGDEMIRNLARRLVKVDLLSQAASLLQYQIDSRLKGVAQAQVAADLALIQIANRNPEAALRALNRTQMANLSPTLERQRRVLEARALIDAGREDLALDLLARVPGRDADLVRVDGYWKIKNYSAASDLIETIYSGDATLELSQPARMNILKAGVGLVLAGDKLGLSRIRSKFADRMARSAEWGLFDFITGPRAASTSAEFKVAAKQVAGLDSLSAFLTAYRQIYPVDPGLTPSEPVKLDAV